MLAITPTRCLVSADKVINCNLAMCVCQKILKVKIIACCGLKVESGDRESVARKVSMVLQLKLNPVSFNIIARPNNKVISVYCSG